MRYRPIVTSSTARPSRAWFFTTPSGSRGSRRNLVAGAAALVVAVCVLWRSISWRQPHLWVGTDVSEAYGIQDRGGVYKRRDGTPVDALEIVHENGYDYVRLRIMMDPSGAYGLFQDESYIVRMARHAKHDYNMKVLLDFHYSHWWADGQNQWSASRWRNTTTDTTMAMPELVEQVYEYTRVVMQVLQAEDIVPDAVQIGNEISAGMLWDHGRLPPNWNQMAELPVQWRNLASLLQAGIRAVNDTFPKKSERPLIVIHLDTGGDTEFTELWKKTYFGLGGTCDVIGLSWYPMWHGTMKDLKRNINNLSEEFPSGLGS